MTEHSGRSHNIARLTELFDVDPGLSAFLKVEIFHQREWSALLFEQRLQGDASRAVAVACEKAGFSTAVCIDIDENVYEPFQIRLDTAGVERAHLEFHTPSYAIVETDERFIIVSDNDYYWAIAGHRSFVESVFDTPWKKLLDEFEASVEPYTRTQSPVEKRLSRNLSDYLDLCRSSFID